VQAPLEAVRTQVLDFSHYKDLSGGKFKTARMIAKEGDNTDVYFQVPVLRNAHPLVRLPFRPDAGVVRGKKMVGGQFVRGNIKGHAHPDEDAAKSTTASRS